MSWLQLKPDAQGVFSHLNGRIVALDLQCNLIGTSQWKNFCVLFKLKGTINCKFERGWSSYVLNTISWVYTSLFNCITRQYCRWNPSKNYFRSFSSWILIVVIVWYYQVISTQAQIIISLSEQTQTEIQSAMYHLGDYKY